LLWTDLCTVATGGRHVPPEYKIRACMAHKSALIDSLLQNSNLKFEFAAKEFGLRYINPPRFFGFRHVNSPPPTFRPEHTSDGGHRYPTSPNPVLFMRIF